MAKVDGGALSFGASGTIGNVMTFSSWKGRPYVRRRVIPSNPRTGGQTGVRSAMRWGSREWALMTGANRATWIPRAAQTNISPFNAFVSVGQTNVRNDRTYQREDPAEGADVPAAPTVPTATAEGRQTIINWVDSVTVGSWNVHVYRSLTTPFTPAPSNLIAIVSQGVETYVDAGLTEVTHYYHLRAGNIQGYLGTPTAEFDDS